jgi:galactokinase/mevalonate kinase-like predicted kinase
MDTYDPHEGCDITAEKAKELSDAAQDCWKAIVDLDAAAFGAAMTRSFHAQVSMFPAMMNEAVCDVVHAVGGSDGIRGYKVSGAGGGGYVIFVSTAPVAGSISINARRPF